MCSEIKLYTLPFAGGSSFSYMPWKRYLNSGIELKNLDYPGHGRRMKSKLANKLNDLVEDIAKQIKNDNIENAPFAIYGHSLGGMVAYLTTLELLTKHNMCPSKVIIAACKCPDKFANNKKQKVNYDVIIDELLQGNRVTEQIAKSVEFNTNIYPIIENDFQMINDCNISQIKKQKLNNDIICLYGEEDQTVKYLDILGWKEYTEKNIVSKSFSAGHFFMEDKAKEVCEYINELLM